MASIHASEVTMTAMKATFPHVVLCFIPTHSTSYFKSCIQTQATTTLARSVLDGTLDDVVMNKAWRRQSCGRRELPRTPATKTKRVAPVGVDCTTANNSSPSTSRKSWLRSSRRYGHGRRVRR